MGTNNHSSSIAGDLLLILALASFGTGLALGVGGLLNGVAVGVDGPLLTAPAITVAAPLAGALGAVVVLPAALLLSITT